MNIRQSYEDIGDSPPSNTPNQEGVQHAGCTAANGEDKGTVLGSRFVSGPGLDTSV